MSHHRLDFLIHRPITTEEASEVLAKALERMPAVPAANLSQAMAAAAPARGTGERTRASNGLASNQEQVYADAPKIGAGGDPGGDMNVDPGGDPNVDPGVDRNYDPYFGANDREGSQQRVDRGETWRSRLSEISGWQLAAAVTLALGAALCVWHARDTMLYLTQTHENRREIFHESVAAFFSLTPPVPSTSGATGANVPLDAYVAQASGSSEAPLELKVIRPQAEVSNAGIELHRREDLPLAAPVNAAPEPTGPKPVPESLRGAAPITPPTVVTVSPAQMLPVSIPVPSPGSGDQVSEPVTVSEEAERALLVSSVAPVYPPEAAGQKAQGPVVLQATIGRDGTVEDLKIVRGSFILSKAAITAVKQWRFQPYKLNGHAAQTQTLLTINFAGPA
jgi:protein TonB